MTRNRDTEFFIPRRTKTDRRAERRVARRAVSLED